MNTLTKWWLSLQCLFLCCYSLGLKLGWQYWRIISRAHENPQILIDCADACDQAANNCDPVKGELAAYAYRQWAIMLRTYPAPGRENP